ncbi:MAG: 30S ribosomal protein S20 [candidate division WWE3 bacterium GW2011_GWF1_42_14]|uniref:Small ribosomal subunit protein bS20 n=2 Tax=Katanobacteria TaxID=422282 RepID=A0A0G0YJM9_UNCKA|nr:MAG: 30S ribosomal protein S20 [candidate division WWE3 bacterium GW2011_GWA1_42_12]KKS33908.1 MAG: 30S ribosomal protein S20 [candidate division WWE3 bacterium GW2011_GWD1_42_14]KKS36915.1 MAG: 30S ribosomal protein S20 [candidate division WWE3 bacterium GW2011_GWF1_42_14]KKS39978.1 MAG: 30S ribosomal protein S20 [candidate division WWE3 bacterium GW2011_GWE1_42_16]KKS66360.1 MAG: 30S ribosomal protein S20 [candidate division WWE3 bacterium GW2011_GWB1_42_6]
MLSYVALMPNTKSAKKALRGSAKKRKHNIFWKDKYKASIKSMKSSLVSSNGAEVVKDQMQVLQKVLDKASKEKVIHKNKANRLKSRYARKVSALSQAPGKTRKKS